MSKPRRPFGAQLPGRLQATMIKVIAAEMSDPGRLNRGKRYHADDAVLDITVGRGAVTGEVQGGRAEPYVVTIEVDPGTGVPRRDELWVSCTCPDDSGTGREACKHAVATMLALANEIAIEPELLERLRTGRTRPSANDETGPATVYDIRSGRPITPDHSTVDHEAENEPDEVGLGVAKEADVISPMLIAPNGSGPPTFGAIEPLSHPDIGDQMLDDVLDDALRHLQIRWE